MFLFFLFLVHIVNVPNLYLVHLQYVKKIRFDESGWNLLFVYFALQIGQCGMFQITGQHRGVSYKDVALGVFNSSAKSASKAYNASLNSAQSASKEKLAQSFSREAATFRAGPSTVGLAEAMSASSLQSTIGGLLKTNGIKNGSNQLNTFELPTILLHSSSSSVQRTLNKEHVKSLMVRKEFSPFSSFRPSLFARYFFCFSNH